MAGDLKNPYNIYDAGFGKDLVRGKINSPDLAMPLQDQNQVSESGFSGGLFDPIEGTTPPASIRAGELPALIGHGKPNFDSTVAGFLMGLDSDKNYKWIIGDAASSIDWSATTIGALTIVGTINSSTITGGTIQTATSGKRIVLTGASNNMTFYNSSSSGVMDIGTSGTVIMRILPTNDDLSGLIVQNNSSLTLTSRLVEISVLKSASTAAALYVSNDGSGDAVTVNPNATGKGMVISNVGSGQSLYITQTSASNANHALEIDIDGTGRGIYLHDDKTTSTNYSLLIEKAGTGVAVKFENTNSDVSTGVVLELSQTAVVSTNFKKVLALDGVTIWKSNGTTPNGNLSGTAGDICVNGSGSAAFYCTGTTNWTTM